MFTIMTPFCFPNTFLLTLEGKKLFFLILHWTSQVVPDVKNLLANAGDIRDMGSIPELGRSPGEGHGNPFQYSYLDNLMDRGT